MTMNRDVFLAILAMDSYNRGYGSGVGVLSQTGSIGTASIGQNADDPEGVAEAFGFYAIAYNWNGERIISFRRTDFTTGWSKVLDIVNGWSSFTGIGTNSQFALAREFYKSVAGRDFPNTNGVYAPSNITFTGHSLGGALAGSVGWALASSCA